MAAVLRGQPFSGTGMAVRRFVAGTGSRSPGEFEDRVRDRCKSSKPLLKLDRVT